MTHATASRYCSRKSESPSADLNDRPRRLSLNQSGGGYDPVMAVGSIRSCVTLSIDSPDSANREPDLLVRRAEQVAVDQPPRRLRHAGSVSVQNGDMPFGRRGGGPRPAGDQDDDDQERDEGESARHRAGGFVARKRKQLFQVMSAWTSGGSSRLRSVLSTGCSGAMEA